MRHIRRTIAALIIMLPLLFAQPATGCTVAGADLAVSLASASTCLDIPAGEYVLSGSGGSLLQTSIANLDIAGAGMGRTIVRVTGTMTLTSDLLVWRLLGVGQHLHDLTVQTDGAGIHGPWGVGAVSVGLEGERITIERVEVVGGYSSDGARGFGIGTYRLFSTNGGAQYVTIRDCYVHDSPATGIGVNSNNNLIVGNHIARVGTNGLSHGVYAQGGYNLYEGNTIEQAAGYSFHGYKQVPSLDSAGDRFIGNTSINPGSGHIIIQGPQARSATISGNVFRNTAGRRTLGVWCNAAPCLIEANVLEDIFPSNGYGWIEDGGGSVITGNTLTTTGTVPDGPINFAGIRAFGNGSVITNNTVTIGVGCCAGIEVMGNDVQVQNNRVSVAGGNVGIKLRGDGGMVQGNRIVSTGTGVVFAFTLSGPTNIFMTGNYLKRAPVLGALFSLNLAGVTGRITGNMYDGTYTFSNAAPGVVQ
jgi:hypothetical protein